VALATAQGLGLALGVPAAGVGSLFAQAARCTAAECLAVQPARRGQVYAIKRAYQLAAKDFDVVIKLSPKDAEAFNNRCWARAAIDDLPAALADCDEALKIAPGAADALDSRGLVYLKMGRTADAIRDYSEALKINPQSASSLFGRGVARKREGGDGETDLALARKIDPGIAKEFAGYGLSECPR
jgi:tetratricopeptide (TPR) repeat protein